MSNVNNSEKLQFILASQSPRRLELIGHLGIKFEVCVPDINEDIDIKSGSDLVRELSFQKAKEAERLLEKNKKLQKNHLILAADTTVVLGDKILGKPHSREDAKKMLSLLSGNTHTVYTGFCLLGEYDQQKIESKQVVASDVTFTKIDSGSMELYLDSGESLDKAGSYGIQGQGLLFVEKVNGSYSNVVGLPLSDVLVEIKKISKKWLKEEHLWRELFWKS